MSGEILNPVTTCLNAEVAPLDHAEHAVSTNHNPLHCLMCKNPLNEPVLLQCHHVFCKACVLQVVLVRPVEGSESSGSLKCPLCTKEISLTVDRVKVDPLVKYLVDSTHEQSDVCANCDQINQPMQFCETCHQPLCNNCKNLTHQAKMFSAHIIVPLEERTGLHGSTLCRAHNEQLILFSSDQKQLKCIKCFQSASAESRPNYIDLEVAHKQGCQKLEKQVSKLKNFQQEVQDEILLYRKMQEELTESATSQRSQVQQIGQEMIDALLQGRDRLLASLHSEFEARQDHFQAHLRRMGCLLPSIRLYLLCSSIFCSSATKIDFLQHGYHLIKRISALICEHQSGLNPTAFTGQLDANCREEFARVLEPFLGLSSFILPNLKEFATPSSGNSSPGSYISAYYRGRGRRPLNGGYVNCPSGGPLSQYQLVVDLSGAFGDEFAKVEGPIKEFVAEMSGVSVEAQELQKDLTLRRCLVDRKRVQGLLERAKGLESKILGHSALVQDVQHSLQLIWQEQLDRVRRQQMMFRQQVETNLQLKEDLRLVVQAVSQLQPYIDWITKAVQTANPRRCHPPDPAPMEQICSQIQQMEPDSQSRVDAIEKEEKNRKAVMEQRKKDYADTLVSLKKQLKSSKETPKKKSSTGCSAVTVVRRDRSRRGHDPALLSPNSNSSKRSSWAGAPRGSSSPKHELLPSPSVSSMSSDLNSSLDDSFEQMEQLMNSDSKPISFCSNMESGESESKIKLLSISLPDSQTWTENQDKGQEVKETKERSESSPEPRELEKEFANKLAIAESPVKAPIPKAPRFLTNLVGTVEQSTLEAREKVLASLIERVPRVEIGVSNSPVREISADETEEVTMQKSNQDQDT